MNTKISFSIFLFALLFSTSMFAQKSEEIKVWGNCGMCKKVIETAALKAGASTASWSEKPKCSMFPSSQRRQMPRPFRRPLLLLVMIRRM